jgi:serine/threonine protein kinase
VVTVYEIGTAGGREFIAMELVEGETLAQWLHSSRQRPAAILDVFRAAGCGLAAAHAAGIVHRDFKPSNVLCSRDGRVLVSDFGLACATKCSFPDGPRLDVPSTIPGMPTAGSQEALTVTAAVLGTPPYMAPEQWSGRAITPATDQFAFCVALWEALAGDRPYRGVSRDELRQQILRGPAELDAARIPRALRGVLRRGLDSDPARRWRDMACLLAQLEHARRMPSRVGMLCAAAVTAALSALLALRDGASSSPPRLQPVPVTRHDSVSPGTSRTGKQANRLGRDPTTMDPSGIAQHTTIGCGTRSGTRMASEPRQRLDRRMHRYASSIAGVDRAAWRRRRH